MDAPWLTFAQYPRFSPTEMARRRTALLDIMEGRDIDHLVVYGWQRPGSAVQWLTGWPVTREAVVIITPTEPNLLFVQFFNHVPNAREIVDTGEVRWGGNSTIASIIGELERRGAVKDSVGLIGPMPYNQHQALSSTFGHVVDLSVAYRDLRLVSSSEEVEWFRIGAELSDRAIEAIRTSVRPGITEFELADIVERSYVPLGGLTHIHFFGVTPMTSPTRCVPAQHPSGRVVAKGDILTTEISATYWGYPGQVLKTFTVDEDPTPIYEELFRVAEQVFQDIFSRLQGDLDPHELIEVADLIDEAGFSIYDDLVHCFGGGGEIRPVIVRRSAGTWEVTDEPLRANMTVVIQPNIITPDETAGVQIGELVLITPRGAERLHRSTLDLERIGG